MPKTPKCKSCGELGHYSINCRKVAKKPIKTPSTKLKVKKPVIKRKKPETRSKLIKRLDSVYSQYIRLDKSDANGFCRCITCNDVIFWKDIQNGHYISRAKYPTRWNDDNCFPQCVRCNIFLKGNYIEYTLFMIDSYSREFIDDQKKLSQTTIKLSSQDLRDKITHYKTVVERIKSEKSLA